MKPQKQLKTKFEITGIFVKDPVDQGFTGFFREIPEAVAEGDTEEEAVLNLLAALPYAAEMRSKIAKENAAEDNQNKNTSFTKTFEFELA